MIDGNCSANWRLARNDLHSRPRTGACPFVGTDGRAKIVLNCPDGPVLPIDVRGLDTATLKKALHIVEQELSKFCQAWRSIHGTY